MIYSTGYQLPTTRQNAHVKNRADGTFASQIKDWTIFDNVPGCEIGEIESAIALKAKCVEPHTDPWVGYGDEPKKYLSVFWLIKSSSGLIIQVGNDAKRLLAGEFIVFDDRVMHSVVSKNTWYGMAYQIAQNEEKVQS